MNYHKSLRLIFLGILSWVYLLPTFIYAQEDHYSDEPIILVIGVTDKSASWNNFKYFLREHNPDRIIEVVPASPLPANPDNEMGTGTNAIEQDIPHLNLTFI